MASPKTLAISGVTPWSSCDLPGALCAVVFCQGCPWHCGYCHNPHLLPPGGATPLIWRSLLELLGRRRGLLDGVVFSGGEPTAQPALYDACRQVRELGFKVGLHTAGMYPRRLESILPYLDWIAMDIKAPFPNYDQITGVRGSGRAAAASARLIAASGIPHELRTTVHPAITNRDDIGDICNILATIDARIHYVLQPFRMDGCADPTLSAYPGLESAWTRLIADLGVTDGPCRRVTVSLSDSRRAYPAD